MPFIEQNDGTNMFETEDICKHLAVMGGKFVVDAQQEKLCHTANSHPMQTADPYLNMPEAAWEGFKLPPKADWIKEVAPVLKELAAELGAGPFFAGSTPGYGEAFIWQNIDNQMLVAHDEIAELVGEEDVKKLKAFHQAFAALPGIKEYLDGRPKQFGAPGSKASTLNGADTGAKDAGADTGAKDAGTLVYFAGLRSRGEPCRMIAAYGNVAMKDKLLTFDEWGAL